MVLFRSWSGQRVVSRCCPACERAGVRAGMTLAQALALPGVGADPLVMPVAPEADRRALHRLACLLLRFSPIVGVDPDTPWEDGEPDGLLMDVSGCAHLFGGEAALAARVERFVRRLGVECRVGVGGCVGEAWGAARFGGGGRGSGEAWASWPIEALRLPVETRSALRELGVERVGEVMRLPRSSLPARFGPMLSRRLDQLRGLVVELIEPVRPPPAVEVSRRFDGPCARWEAVAASAEELLGELMGLLAERGLGVRWLEVEVHRLVEPGATNRRGRDVVRQVVRLSRASGHARHVWSLLRPRLERLNLGFGVDRLVARAARTGRTERRQLGIGAAPGEGTPTGDDGERLAELVDTLSNRLGEWRVRRAVLTGSHVPERSFVLESALRFREPTRREEREGARLVMARAERSDRPALLSDPPEPAHADEALTVLRWRGRAHRVRRVVGPEWIGPEWWDRRGDGGVESLFHRVQLESGLWVWVERRGDAWRVRGVWG